MQLLKLMLYYCFQWTSILFFGKGVKEPLVRVSTENVYTIDTLSYD
jgi:hypothetical protein